MSKVLEQYLEPGEEIIWWGKPHPKLKSPATWVIQIWGVFCFLGTGIMTLMVMLNLDEMEGAWGFVIFFLVIGVSTTVAFLFFFPSLQKKSNAATIYAVTNTSVLVLSGLGAGRLQRMYVDPDQDIRLIRYGRALYDVRYFFQSHKDANAGRYQITYQFSGLELKDAEQARAALLKSQGRIE